MNSIKLRILSLSTLSLLGVGAPLAAQTQPADYFFLAGATNYLRTNVASAKQFVSNGLSLYPADQKLTNLWALLNQNSQSQSSSQDNNEQQQKDQQQKSEQE